MYAICNNSFPFIYSYLLNVPFNNDDGTGIVYAWIGLKSDPEDARLITEIAEEMFNNVSSKSCINSKSLDSKLI